MCWHVDANRIYWWSWRRVEQFEKKNEIKKVQKSESTNKYLFELIDGNYIEAVLMRHNYGNSVCVSSQVGCNMGCKFCESGRLKKKSCSQPNWSLHLNIKCVNHRNEENNSRDQ